MKNEVSGELREAVCRLSHALIELEVPSFKKEKRPDDADLDRRARAARAKPQEGNGQA
jgi:hypothetical protein